MTIQVGWDESTAGERQPRVSLWEIEPLTTFPMYPSPFSLRLKRPWPSGLPPFPGLKDGDMGMTSPISWLRGGMGDQGMQSLNFQGLNASPWMQPRLDPSMYCLQPDAYQVMAAAALQETGSLDPSKFANQSLQFQPNVPNVSASLMQNQMLQQPHSHQSFLQNIPDNVVSQSQLLQQQLQNRQQFINQQQQLQQSQQFQDQMVKKTVPTSLQIGSSSESQFTPTSQLQNFSDLIGNHMASSNNNNSSMQSLLSSFSHEGPSHSHLANLNGSHPLKRVALDPQHPSRVSQFGVPHPEELLTSTSKVSDLSALLPQFPGKEFSEFQHSHDNMLFGTGTNSSANMLNGSSTIRNNGNQSESVSMPFATPTFANGSGTDFPLTSDMTTSSCVDESGYMQSSENVDQTNPTTGAFVKVTHLVLFKF